MAITLFHPARRTRRVRGMAVLDNSFGLENKQNCGLKLSLQLW